MARILLIIFVVSGLFLFFGNYAGAESGVPTNESTANLSVSPGRTVGSGKYFEIKDSQYLNVSLTSTEGIRAIFESMPKIINLNIGAIVGTSTSTDLKISGLEINKTYFKYEDSYKNRIALSSDDEGTISWTQDLAAPHHVWLQETESTTYINQDTLLDSDIVGSVEIDAHSVTLDCQGHQILGDGNGFGIYLNDKTEVTIKNCVVKNFNIGIFVSGSLSWGNTISKNDVSGNTGYGLYLASVWWWPSSGNSVIENQIHGNYRGLEIFGSLANSISGNNVFDNADNGFLISWGSSNILRNNSIADNKFNFGVYGGWVSGAQDIDTSNTVNGKPIYFLVNEQDKIIDATSNAGYVGAVNSKNITIKDVAISGNLQGVYLEGVSDSVIDGAKLSGNLVGLEMNYCSRDRIMNSKIFGNDWLAGIKLWISFNNIIADNDIYSNQDMAVYLTGDWDNSSHDNKIYHNNFENNWTNIAADRTYSDVFDDGYPSGGNYYSDYAGVDEKSGPAQDQPGADGIGDTAYTFNGGQDRYPLMKPVEINPPQKWSFAIISDLHVGEPPQVSDYGNPGWDDGTSGNDNIASIQNLKRTIGLINSDIEKYNLKFVVVDGDLTDSAEISELNKTKEILNSLRIPWVPVAGNHDLWPYARLFPYPIPPIVVTTAPEIDTDKNGADKFFNDIFGSQYEDPPKIFQNWERATTTLDVWNSETDPNHYSYFQNFSFDFNGYHFIGLDFNFRDDSSGWVWGVKPKAQLHNFSGGSWDWFKKHVNDYLAKNPTAEGKIILLSHHPFRKWKQYEEPYTGIGIVDMGFSSDELATVSNFLDSYKENIAFQIAGHSHENKATSLNGAVKSIETAANVNNPLARIVQFYPNGDINYSDMLGYALTVTAHSPVDLEVTDPDGLIINKQTNQIPGAEYIEEDIDGNGDLSDRIQILDKKLGDYKIKVIPEANASSTATYSLDVSELENDFGYVPTILAENVPVSQIPTEPYNFEVKQKNATQLTYFGDLSGQYSDSVILSATLADNNGSPLAGKNITFQIGEQTVSATTNTTGVALSNLTLTQTPGKYYLVEANFAGDADNLPAYNSASFEILKEGTTIKVSDADGFAFATTTSKAQILDDDGNVLLGDPRAVEFRVGDKVIGNANIDGKGEAKIDWSVDIIPKNLTETYKISASFAGDDYYLPANGQADLTLKSAQWFKKDAIIKLGAVSQGDLLVSQAIKSIQNSLSDDLWLDASHIIFFGKDCSLKNQTETDPEKVDPEKLFNLGNSNGINKNCSWLKSGLRVFGGEYLAVKLLQTRISAKPKISDAVKNTINQAIGELVKADLLLARVAIYDAKNTPIKNLGFQKSIQNQISKAEENLTKAEELSGKQPDKAIAKLSISWLRAQLAAKLAGL